MKTRSADVGKSKQTRFNGFPRNRDFRAYQNFKYPDLEFAQMLENSGALKNKFNSYHKYVDYYNSYVNSGQYAQDKAAKAAGTRRDRTNAGKKIVTDIIKVTNDRASRFGEGLATAGKFITDVTNDGIDTAVSNLVTSKPVTTAIGKAWSNTKMFFRDVVDFIVGEDPS